MSPICVSITPNEAKDPEKQKAGRLRQRKHNLAAVPAAPTSKRKVMMISNHGAIENKEEKERLNNFHNYNSLSGYRQDNVNAVQEDIKKREITDRNKCYRCEELTIKLQEYEEALAHVPFIAADQINKSNSKYKIPKEKHYLLENALLKCNSVYYITFDSLGNLISAEPDVLVSNDFLKRLTG